MAWTLFRPCLQQKRCLTQYQSKLDRYPYVLSHDNLKGIQHVPLRAAHLFLREGLPSHTLEPAIFQTTRPLYLASASPRRIAFLRDLGLPVNVISPPESSEPSPCSGEPPETYALRAGLAKARAVLPLVPQDMPHPVIIAADTIVTLDDRILGKPLDPEDALSMLRTLTGKTHTVITGCALLSVESNTGETVEQSFAISSRVTMWDCPEAMLRAYAYSGEPLDKAGAYAVQGAGAFLVERIEGSWSNVVGLPLAEVVQALCAMDALTAL